MTGGRLSESPAHASERRDEAVASYYAATAYPAPLHPELRGEMEADVCVIGGGYTGLSTALELAERGYQVALLEAARVGWGASGRNGGQVCSGMPTEMSRIEDWVGREDAHTLFRLAEEGKALVAQRVARHRIHCDLSWGYVMAAHSERDMKDLRAMKAEWEEGYGYSGLRQLDRADLARHVASPVYHGGLFDPGAGHLHPLNYCLGLARAATRAGVRIFERSRVIRLEGMESAAPTAVTSEGRLRARFLVLACNAYLDNLVPRLEGRILPVGTYIAATEPLGALARELMPSGAAVVDCRRMLDYYRMTPDGRLLFGARTGAFGIEQQDPAPALRRHMRKVFPGLAERSFDYVWGGRVALTPTRTPQVGRLGQAIFYAQGYTGHGLALTGIVGRVIAEAIDGRGERLALLERLPQKRFPFGRRLRTPGIAAGILWHKFLDGIGL